MFAHIPESKQRHTETQTPVDILRLKQPVERETEVIDLGVALRQPVRPVGGVQFRIPFLRQDQTVGRMGAARGRLLAAIDQAFEGIFANRFEHGETRLGFGAVHALHQIFVHQRGQAFKEIDAQVAARVADGLGRLQRASADEDGKAAKQSLLGFIQQIVAPVDGLAERLLTFRQVERTAGE